MNKAGLFVIKERLVFPPQPEDLQDLSELNQLALKQKREMSQAQFEFFLQNPFYFLFIARLPRTKRIIAKQAAYLFMLDSGKWKAIIEQVAIHPKYRRLGIAESLYAFVEKYLRTHELTRGLGSVEYIDLTSKNPEAQSLYFKCGFEKRNTMVFRKKIKKVTK